MRYLIRNGMIVDGTGRAPFAGSVLTRDSKIEAIFPGRDNEQARQAALQDVVVLDAGGGYITPGFVDIHRHGDWQALERGDDELLNRQGITTVINGNCGLSAAPQGGPHEAETDHFLRRVLMLIVLKGAQVSLSGSGLLSLLLVVLGSVPRAPQCPYGNAGGRRNSPCECSRVW